VFGIGLVVLPSCGLWGCALRFLAVLGALCNLYGLNLHGFGAG